MGFVPAGRTMFGCVAAVLLFTAALAFAGGSLPAPVYHTSIDWQDNSITIDASVDIGGLGPMLPNTRQKAIQIIENDRQNMIEKALFPIVEDSFHTVGDLAGGSPSILTAVQNLLHPKDQVYTKLSPDLKTLTIQYQVPIFPDLGAIFVNQVKANPPSPILTYVPTTKFSGIVIYAKGRLPVHGENRTSELVPSLFPRIWDENMRLLASSDTVDPAVLRSEGVAAFSDSTDEKPFTARIGLTPFRTVAMGLFGKHPTDVIISNRAADRILASPDNIRLLTEGRILIIADLPQTRVTQAP